MIRHIVFFQLKADLIPQVKQQAMNDFRDAILALPEKIKLIRHIEVGFNCNPDEKWDICLNGEFDSLNDVKAYAVNPFHLAAAGALKSFLSGRSCVDYEY